MYSVKLSFHIFACSALAAWKTRPGGTGGVIENDRLSCHGGHSGHGHGPERIRQLQLIPCVVHYGDDDESCAWG